MFCGLFALLLPTLADAQEVIVSENFSKFVAGSVEAPSEKDVADEYTTYIPSELTQKEGWTGAAIHQAGGVCLVSNYFSGWDMEDGYLNTPVGDYSGKITIRFRAKSQKKYDDPIKIFASVASRSTNLGGSNFELTDEWKSYTTTISIEANDKALQAMVQFTATRDVKFFIDDIEVVRQKGLLPYPKVDGYEALKADGFTAKWLLLDDIDTYLVSVYSKLEYQASDSIAESFDAIQLTADNQLASNDLGRLVVSLSSSHPVYIGGENSKSANRSLYMVAKDWVEVKESKKPLVHASFWAKAAQATAKGSILVDQYVGNEWIELVEIDTKGMPDFKFVALDQYLNFNASAIRIRYQGEGGIYLDDLKIYYEPDHKMLSGFEAKEVKGVGRLEVTDLDPEVDYYFSVKSKKGEEVSLPSEEVFVYGLITPTTLEASDIDVDRFVARWTATPKAEGYVLNNYNKLSAVDTEECVVYDEKFDKVNVGVSRPEEAVAGKKNNAYLDDYTQYPGWMGAQTIMTDGMIGTKGFSAAITSPNIILMPKGKSRSVRVVVRAWAQKGTDLAMQVNGKRPEGVEPIHFEQTGFVEKEIQFDYSAPEDIHLSFLSWSGEAFLLDAIKVSVVLEKDASVSFINNRINITKKRTEYAIGELANVKNLSYYYNVQAFRIIGKNVIFSDLSENVNVVLKKKDEKGVEEILQHEAIMVQDATIVSQDNQPISVYDMAGKELAKRYLYQGEMLSLREFDTDLVIIKTAKKSYKVVVR